MKNGIKGTGKKERRTGLYVGAYQFVVSRTHEYAVSSRSAGQVDK
jgi:hypothetical protein